jgi:hypothetical protein
MVKLLHFADEESGAWQNKVEGVPGVYLPLTFYSEQRMGKRQNPAFVT